MENTDSLRRRSAPSIRIRNYLRIEALITTSPHQPPSDSGYNSFDIISLSVASIVTCCTLRNQSGCIHIMGRRRNSVSVTHHVILLFTIFEVQVLPKVLFLYFTWRQTLYVALRKKSAPRLYRPL